MRILELEQKFKSEETLTEALKECEDDFNTIDYWSGVRKGNVTDNPPEIVRALNELSGCFANLRTALAIANTELTNREAIKRNLIKIEIERDGTKKWTSQANSAAKYEAIEAIKNYTRIKNIIEAYCNSADKHISTLQTISKDASRDWKHPQG